MKYVIIGMDGVADRPLSEIGNKTPLQVAQTPHIDALVKRGIVGWMQNTPEGLPPGSDVCSLSLLGYNPSGFYSGRAPYEAASMGVEQKDNEMVFRCNLVHVEEDKMVDFSAGHISSEEAKAIITTLNEEWQSDAVRFYAGIGYRHILVLDMTVLEEKFTGLETTPPHDIMGQGFEEHLPKGAGEEIVKSLMQQSEEILKGHPINLQRLEEGKAPANKIWLWGQGSRPEVALFKDLYHVTGSMISAVDLLKGIGKLTGLDVLDVPGATGYYDTDYAAKAEYALNSLKDKDFVFVHVEATDEAGHNGDLKEKIRAIENIDEKIIGPVVQTLEEQGTDYRIMVAPDHPTPIALRTHTKDPVPFVMAGAGIEGNNKLEYSEEILKDKTALSYVPGHLLMDDFLHKDIL